MLDLKLHLKDLERIWSKFNFHIK